MTALTNKIDFIVTIDVENANPNGDPLGGNTPRMTADGLGLISDVAIKRKIRNRLQDICQNDEGYRIFVQANDRSDDGAKSLEERFNNIITEDVDLNDFKDTVNKTWLDVRSFGHVFTFAPKTVKDKGKKVSKLAIGVRGPVSISPATSVETLPVTAMQITRSTNSEDKGNDRDSSTMGMKYFVDRATYVIKGSISPNLAETTGFSQEDAKLIKEALRTLFENDQSAARPDGSMTVRDVYWFEHSNKLGNVSSARIYKLLSYNPETKTFDLDTEKLDAYKDKGLSLDIIEGF